MKQVSVFFLLCVLTISISAQQVQHEKLLKKGTSRFYSFSVRVGSKMYFLNNARYDQYGKVFTGSIAKVDSINNPDSYVLGWKEMQIVVDSISINSVFITIPLKQIRQINQQEK